MILYIYWKNIRKPSLFPLIFPLQFNSRFIITITWFYVNILCTRSFVQGGGNKISASQLLSNQRGSMTLHLTGGRVFSTIDGRDVGKNSPGHRRRASANSNPTRMPRSRGASTLVRRFPLAFRGQTNTSRESPVESSDSKWDFLSSVLLADS